MFPQIWHLVRIQSSFLLILCEFHFVLPIHSHRFKVNSPRLHRTILLLISSGPAPSTRASSTVLTMLSAHGDGWGQSSQAHALRAIDDFFPKCHTIEKGIISVFRISFERTLLSLMSKGLIAYSLINAHVLKPTYWRFDFSTSV